MGFSFASFDLCISPDATPLYTLLTHPNIDHSHVRCIQVLAGGGVSSSNSWLCSLDCPITATASSSTAIGIVAEWAEEEGIVDWPPLLLELG